MCQNCHVFNGKYHCLDTASHNCVDADASNTCTTTATHHKNNRTLQEDNASTQSALHVTGKVPPAFVESIINSLTNMGHAVTITHHDADEEEAHAYYVSHCC